MNTGYLLRKVGGFIFAALLLTGITMLSSTETQAQRRHSRVIIVRPIRPFYPYFWHRYGYGYDDFRYRQYVFDNAEDAAEQGYKDGYKTGSKDGKKDKSYSYERSHYYHDAGFGNYAEVYRSNFARGYDEGYRNGGAG